MALRPAVIWLLFFGSCMYIALLINSYLGMEFLHLKHIRHRIKRGVLNSCVCSTNCDWNRRCCSVLNHILWHTHCMHVFFASGGPQTRELLCYKQLNRWVRCRETVKLYLACLTIEVPRVKPWRSRLCAVCSPERKSWRKKTCTFCFGVTHFTRT